MNNVADQYLDRAMEYLVEQLASIEHERWAHWQAYLHKQGQRQNDGSIVLPAELVSRWERQIATSYAELTPDEQSSDREQVMKYLPLIMKMLQLGS
ncbi:TPA: hypothetical protein ACWX5B_000300 [Stenotrophomonas maltophilia]